MAVTIPNGAKFFIASGYATSKQMTAVTNANPAVATLEASHGIVTSDYLEVTSGWEQLDGRIVKAGTVATNNVPLLGIDASSTTIFPTGAGAGSVRKISAWQQITQVLSVSASGGDQQYADYQFLESMMQRRIPTVRSPIEIKLGVADDPSLGWMATVQAASVGRVNRAIRMQLPNGAEILFNAAVSLGDMPSMNTNDVMATEITLSLNSYPVRV